MRIAVTGCGGQVARSLRERALAAKTVEIVCVGRPALDLAHPETIAPALAAVRPDVVVSAAAYTAVDRAEDEPAMAFAVNAEGAAAVARAAAGLGAPVIHLSTDYVFSGTGERPYVETDATGPQSVYGASKLAGEIGVAAANPRHLILRTAWVYSPFGGNFVETVLRLAAERRTLRIVADQWGNPTSALDIADAVIALAGRLADIGSRPESGVFHLAGSGTVNWAGFARHILSVSRRLGGPEAQVVDIATEDYPTRARRPANSTLSIARVEQAFGIALPDWETSVEMVVERLVAERRSGPA